MTDIRRVGDAGIHTVEGNLAGNRAAMMTKEREAQKAKYEAAKNKIKHENAAGLGQIDDKFNTASDALEQEFRKKTVGLVSADDFRKARESINEQRADIKKNKELQEQKRQESKQLAREKKRKKTASALSFGFDDGDGAGSDGSDAFVSKKKDKSSIKLNDSPDEGNAAAGNGSKKKSLKNPAVDTSFLPDAERERELQAQREKLQKEWLEEQERIKNELLEVTYSYWDGSGHRKVITIRKGATIGKFLEMVKQQLIPEFHEVRTTNVDDFVYVKEDLIIPHHYSFYDLIVTKARGKSGPLFHFDVHDDVRFINDATVEKDESHPGKVAERRWYERNKHIFPASRWEVYDPKVDRGNEKYTIHGGEVNNDK